MIRKKDKEKLSGVHCHSSMEVPEIPASYRLTGARNKVIPSALITPARRINRKFDNFREDNWFFSWSLISHHPFYTVFLMITHI